jgi:hypothetical protein
MTASTPDELIAGLPHSSLPKVTGEPTFEDLKVIRRLLNTQAMTVSSYVGGGRHGHVRIIMTNEEYFAIAADVFPATRQSRGITRSCGGHDGSSNRRIDMSTS